LLQLLRAANKRPNTAYLLKSLRPALDYR